MPRQNRFIDLHAHTTASDGTESPAELVEQAHGAGLAAIAVTDHDTVDGIADARRRAEEIGIEVVPGIEISAATSSPGVLHILGYLIDEAHPALLERLEWVQASRANRNPRIIERLNELGVEITLEDAERISGSGQLGRPHIAQAMVDRGAVANVQEAFDKYLDSTAPAYIHKERLPADEAIELIRNAGGVAVMAHPYQTKITSDEELEQFVADLAAIGLGGIECYYSKHSEEQTGKYLDLAHRYGLVATGGSDFHGTSKPDIHLGVVGSVDGVPYSVIDELREHAGSPRANG